MKTLQELFNTKSSDWYTSVEDGWIIYSTIVNKTFVSVAFDRNSDKVVVNDKFIPYKSIEIGFSTTGIINDTKTKLDDYSDSAIYHMNMISDVQITNRGDAKRIFGVVINKSKEFIKQYKPDIIMFRGKQEGGRSELYDALAKRADKKLSDYTLVKRTESKIYSGVGGKETLYTLQRNSFIKKIKKYENS